MAGCDSEVVKAAFKKFDKDNNGLITYDELEAVFKEIGGFANDEELRKIIASVSQSAGVIKNNSEECRVVSIKCITGRQSFFSDRPFLDGQYLVTYRSFTAYFMFNCSSPITISIITKQFLIR